MKVLKVKITKLAGQTGLLVPGTVHTKPAKVAQHWVNNGWAEFVAKAKPKKKTTSKKSK